MVVSCLSETICLFHHHHHNIMSLLWTSSSSVHCSNQTPFLTFMNQMRFCFGRRFRLNAADHQAPADVNSLFEQYSENGFMSAQHLTRFLTEVQGEHNAATLEQAEAIIDEIETRRFHVFHRRGLTLEAFFNYLLRDANSPLDHKLGIHQDMTAPLSHYFIYTSHNTYLTGNQLSSDSSDIPIIRALHGGVRGIELDLWPNSSKDNVIVLHGWTLTTPVELIKCLRSIKEHAFVASDYPVVITLEDHLTPHLQALVAEMITQTFGDMLYSSTGPENMRELPSPESLKRRIIISTKPPKECVEVKKVEVREINSQKEHPTSEYRTWRREIKHLKQNCDKDDNMVREDSMDGDRKLLQRVASDYRAIIAILAGNGRRKLRDWLQENSDHCAKRLSLSEQVFHKVITEYGNENLWFTGQNLLRVYPKAIRVDSSNFNPLNAWIHGAQMVALNMQGYGKSLWLMHGMFRANGGCGYIKKPDFLLKSDSNTNVSKHFGPGTVVPIKTSLKVTMYMGEGWYSDFSDTHFNSYSPPDLYAKIGIAGVPSDQMKKKTGTEVGTWTPTWGEAFDFPLTTPELALLWIEVRVDDPSGKGKLAGQTCLPVWELRKGIRAVPLYNRKGMKYKSVKLLMRFELS